MIDLEPKMLEQVREILEHHVPDCEVRAYGSRVSGKARKFSDLDLVVVGDGPMDIATLSSLREAFANSDLPISIDIQDWAEISQTFRRIIEREYEILYQAGSQV